MPVTSWSQQSQEVDIRRSRKIGSKQLRQMASRSDRILLPKQHSLTVKMASVPTHLSLETKIDTVNTPENRFVKYVLKEFERFCGAVCQHIENTKNLTENYPHIYVEAKQLEDKFSEYLSHSLFREIHSPTSLALNSPILQRKEGYREVLRVWLMYDLAAKLIWNALDNDLYHVGKRDVATLYEYWLFFKLLRLIEDVFEVSPKETKQLIVPTNDGLSLQLLSGKHTAIEGEYQYKGREICIKFNYNKTFSQKSYLESGSSSWTQQMRPDYTLSLWPKAFTEHEAEYQAVIVHVHFDAKYKVEGLKYLTNKEEVVLNTETSEKILNEEKTMQKQGSYKRADLLKMHAYKDAIRRTVGAYVLYPGEKANDYRGFHEIVPGLGAFPVSPLNKADGLDAVRQFINEVVDHFCNRSSQREQFSYHQYDIHKASPNIEVREIMPEYLSTKKVRSSPPSESTVLIGFYKGDKQYNWIKEQQLYNIRVDAKNGLSKYGTDETGAKYLLLHGGGIDGSITSDIWEITSDAPELVSKKDLKNKKKYPTEPSCDYYLVYQIQPIEKNSFGDNKWDIRQLPRYKKGHESARPFSATLVELSKVIFNNLR